MGGYAEVVRASFPGAVPEPHLPVDTGWVVVTTADLSPEEARRLFPSARALCVLSVFQPREHTTAVSYGQVLPGPPPSLTPQTRELLREGFGAAVLLDGVAGTSGRILVELAKLGVTRVAWRDGVGWTEGAPRAVALRKPLLRLEQRLARMPFVSWYRRRVQRARAHLALKQRNTQAFHGESHWLRHLARRPLLATQREPDAPLDIVLYIGQLNSGGAERQLCNLAIGLRRLGHRVRVLTTYPLDAENAHYCDDLAAAGIDSHVAGRSTDPRAVAALAALDIHPEVVGSLPEVIRDPVLDLAGEIVFDVPDVLHCWLDYPNVIGAAAGALVGVPRVVLSTRNLNPTYFPAFYQPWMDHWYGFLGALPEMHLAANSAPGAEDYARWMGVSPSRFRVIYNGVDLERMTAPPAADVERIRRELGLEPGQPLVVGVFRLAAEKQPLLFVDVVARVRQEVPDLKVALVGIGDMEEAVRSRIRAKRIEDAVALLGQRKDVAAILHAADVKLLTSAVEGTPNVILEAQWAGCPPVATDAGGTPDALRDGVTGFLHDVDDGPGLARSVVRLLRDSDLRDSMGRAGRTFVSERFAMDRMVGDTLDHYLALLRLAPSPTPPESVESAIAR